MENSKRLQEEVTKVDDVVIAVGTRIVTNKDAMNRLKMVITILLDKKANLLQIECLKYRKYFHEFCSAVKNKWNLVPYEEQVVYKAN